MSTPELIVSLTSIHGRLQNLPAVIGSILNQTRPPDRVILNLSVAPYLRDAGVTMEDLPPGILDYAAAGSIDICWVDNTGPYRKLLPVLRENWAADCVIVTADDDTFYPSFWLNGLYEAFLAHRCVAAYRCRRIRCEAGRPLPYLQWMTVREVPSGTKEMMLLPTGKEGVLYHPSFFTEDVFDPELIRLAPTTDDITFKLATLVTATPVTLGAYPPAMRALGMRFPQTEESHDGLWTENQSGPNDLNLQRLLDFLKRRGVLDADELFAEGDFSSGKHA